MSDYCRGATHIWGAWAIPYGPDRPRERGCLACAAMQSEAALSGSVGAAGNAVRALAKKWHDSRWTYWREAGEDLQEAIDADDEVCRTCAYPTRETTGLICQTCGWDYARGEKP